MEDRIEEIEKNVSELLKDVSNIKKWIQRQFNTAGIGIVDDSTVFTNYHENGQQMDPDPANDNYDSSCPVMMDDFFEDAGADLYTGGDYENNIVDEAETDIKFGILPSNNVKVKQVSGSNHVTSKLVVLLDKVPQEIVKNLSRKPKAVSEPKMSQPQPTRKSNRVKDGQIVKTKEEPTSITECLYKRKKEPVKRERIRIRIKKPKNLESDPEFTDDGSTSYDESDHEIKINRKLKRSNSNSSNNKNKKGECQVCQKLLNPKSLKEHLRSHQRDTTPKNISCDVCGKFFHFSFDLKKHKRQTNCGLSTRNISSLQRQKEPVQCQMCGKILASKRRLWEHNFIHARETAPKTLTCELCGQSFAFQFHLKKHKYSVHKDEGNLNCRICGKIFNRHYSLKLHVRSHTEIPQCHICGFKSSTTNNLRAHIAKHSAKRDLFCEHCPKSFFSKDVLMKHIKTVHLGQRNFICTLENCNKSFVTSVDLKTHQEIHENKTYECNFCLAKKKKSISYNSPHSLKRHINKVHKEERDFEFKCSLCNASYTKVFSLNYHINTVHKDIQLQQQQEQQIDPTLSLVVMENAEHV